MSGGKHVLESELEAIAQAGGNYIVAASNAPARWLANADYICPGANDDVVINNLVASLYTAGTAGRVTLSPGNFYTTSAIKNYGTTSTTTPTVIIEGFMNGTYIQPASGINAFEVGHATQGRISDFTVLLSGASTGIQDIDGLTSSDTIGWRMRHFRIENFQFCGDTTHTGWGIQIQPFRTIIQNIEGNTGPTGWTYPANGIRLFAASTPNTGSTFNAGDSMLKRVQISLASVAVANGKGLWIDTPDFTTGDGSYFNQMTFEQLGFRSNVVNHGTAIQIGHSGSSKVRSLLFNGVDMENFLIGIDLYNTQGCEFKTYYTSLGGTGSIYFRTDNTGSTNNTTNNHWSLGSTVGVFSNTQTVISDLNGDANNPNFYDHLMVETSGGTAQINGLSSAALPVGVIVQNIGGQQRTGTRHPSFSSATSAPVLSPLPPALATSVGVPGMITYDASFIYVCIATNTWKRAAIATF